METNKYNRIVSADLKNDLKKIFDRGVYFKLQSHAEENWKIWNMFLDCGVATVCIIDTKQSHIYHLEEAKINALDNFIVKYNLKVCGISGEYACVKYSEAY